MLTTILTLLPNIIPALISIGAMIASWYFASKKTEEDYQNLVQANKDLSVGTVANAQTLADYHQQMADDYQRLQKIHQSMADNHSKQAPPKP